MTIEKRSGAVTLDGERSPVQAEGRDHSQLLIHDKPRSVAWALLWRAG